MMIVSDACTKRVEYASRSVALALLTV